MDDIKNRGTSGLSSSGAASGGSKSFRYLQQLTDDDDEDHTASDSNNDSPVKVEINDNKPDMNNNNNEKQSFKMTADNPYHLPIKAVVSSDGNPIMDSLKSKMKEMNINKDRLDRSHSVSNTRGRQQYLSQSSRESAERPASPSPLVPPKSPTFRMTLERGGNPFGGPSGDVISSLKQQITGDRMTLGLKQTRGYKASPTLSRMQKQLAGIESSMPAPTLLPEQSSVPLDTYEYYDPLGQPSNPRPTDYREIIKDLGHMKSKKPEDYYERLIFEKKRRLTPPSIRRSTSLKSASASSLPSSPSIKKRSDSFTKNFYDKYNIEAQKKTMLKSASFDVNPMIESDSNALGSDSESNFSRKSLVSRHSIDNSGISPPSKDKPVNSLPYFIDPPPSVVETPKNILQANNHASSNPISIQQSSQHLSNSDYFENLQKTLEEIYSPSENFQCNLGINNFDTQVELHQQNSKVIGENIKVRRPESSTNLPNIDSSFRNASDSDQINLSSKSNIPFESDNFVDLTYKTSLKEDNSNQKEYSVVDKELLEKSYTDTDIPEEPKKKSELSPKPIICLGSLTPTQTAVTESTSKHKKHVRFRNDQELIEKFIFDNTKYFNDRFRIDDLPAYEEFVKQLQEEFNKATKDTNFNTEKNEKSTGLPFFDDTNDNFKNTTNVGGDIIAQDMKSSIESDSEEVDQSLKIDDYIQTLYQKYSIDELLRSRKPVVTNRINSLLQKYDFHLDRIDSPIPEEHLKTITERRAAIGKLNINENTYQASKQNFGSRESTGVQKPHRRKEGSKDQKDQGSELNQILKQRKQKIAEYELDAKAESFLDNISFDKPLVRDASIEKEAISNDSKSFLSADVNSLLESLDDFVAKRESDSRSPKHSPSKSPMDTNEDVFFPNDNETINIKENEENNTNSKVKIKTIVRASSFDNAKVKAYRLNKKSASIDSEHEGNYHSEIISNFLSFEKSNRRIRPYFDSDKPNQDYSPRRYRSLSEGSDPRSNRPILISSGRRSKSPVDHNIHMKRGSISMTTMSTKSGIKEATPVLAMNHVNKPVTLFLRKDALRPSSLSDSDALPPPPPELIDGPQNNGPSVQSGTFNRMQRDIDAGRGDQVRTVFDAPRNQNQPRSTIPSGPNFKVGKPSAPTFKPMSQTFQANKPPPPPAVNAGEIQNPNSRMLSTGSYPSASPTSPTARSGFPPSSPNSYSQSAAPKHTTPQSPPAAPPASAGGENLICYACQRPLTGPFVSAIGKTWHPECFCCSSCNVSLQNQAFVEENNKLFCEKCYNQYYAPKCAHCNKAIIGNCINALGKSWHPDHFVCSFCGRSFGTEGFLVDSGRPYCGKCFEDLFSVKCGKCGKSITGGEKYVEALNKNWHSTCFTCNQCNVRLEGNSFFVSRGIPYCQNHKAGY